MIKIPSMFPPGLVHEITSRLPSKVAFKEKERLHMCCRTRRHDEVRDKLIHLHHSFAFSVFFFLCCSCVPSIEAVSAHQLFQTKLE